MTNFRPAPYIVAEDDDSGPPIKSMGNFVLMRRYHAVALLEGRNYPTVFVLGRHFGTRAQAELQLPDAEYPTARVTSFYIAFDLDREDQLDAYLRLASEVGRELEALQ